MKSEILIRVNYNMKLGLWLGSEGHRSEKLKEHIRMLDWVLSDSEEVRSIETIVAERQFKSLPSGEGGYAVFK
jgi:hypothetical protein